MINSRLTKLLVGFLCASIIFSIIPRSFGTNVHADTTINYSGENPSSECSYRSVEEASFTAEVKTTNKWSGHSNIEITFKNTGTETIHDWYFTFDFNYKIESPFNCRVIENKDNLYTIGNNDWNQDIKPGESVTIGFTASSKDGTDIKDMPTFYLLNTETVTLKSGDLKYKYEEYSNWSSGFNGALILTNKTKETIRDWTITFGANRPITQADSSVFTDNADGTYTITNDGNNQNIAKGQSYRIGIQGGSNDPSKALTIYSKEQFIKFFENLEYGFDNKKVLGTFKEDLIVSSEKQYTSVDNIILIFHGKPGYINLANDCQSVTADNIVDDLKNCSKIKINNIDCQCCFAGSYTKNTKSVAIELLKATNASAAYGATGLAIYDGWDFNTVVLGFYWKYYFIEQNVLIKQGGFANFPIMYRITNDIPAIYTITDYPA